ncbi:N-acetyltransferase [Stutzerimonas stutzeri]|uniref:N-acetyltransferase n=1 Tax=Stutzerimonas stutzeri TaxID=316 RepID=UPI0015E2F83B|nr:N-acetyltransferase [Stutzerimonas stutzeri]MBA1280441.1 N-acetyltransferase [Stutzerimonas stutzeri]
MKRGRGNSLKYEVYRSESLKTAAEIAKEHDALIAAGVDVAQIRFEPITNDAVEASLLWGDDATLFPWEDVLAWKATDSRGIDISLWFGIELCGLAYASPRNSKLCIKVILLEGKPDKSHPLRGFVAPLVLEAIVNYATLLGCVEIEMEEPAAGAVPWYRKLGFEFDATNRLVMATGQ